MTPSGSGFTVWFTGLPCSGKSTIAHAVALRLLELGTLVELLDGDVVRTHLSSGLDFSKASRDLNVGRIAFVASLLTRNGVPNLVAAISPYREAREAARQHIGEFVEVYVDCELSRCMQRDVKGMYERASRGELLHFTGVDDPYEVPLTPDIHLHTDRESVEESVARVMASLEQSGYLTSLRAATSEQLELRAEELGLAKLSPSELKHAASGRHKLSRR